MSSIIRPAVEHALAVAALARKMDNPITGEPMLGLWGEPENIDIEGTCRAVLAREWFALEHPDLPSLPLSYTEIDDLKTKGDLSLAVALYARSLKINDWDFKKHPGFRDFVGGLLCLSGSHGFSEYFEAYQTDFLGYPLGGLCADGIWRPPVH